LDADVSSRRRPLALRAAGQGGTDALDPPRSHVFAVATLLFLRTLTILGAIGARYLG
jgi:hypothetical protein